MIDFKVMRLTTGENFLCIVREETSTSVTVAFPLVITKQTFPVGDNVMREVHSTSTFCPFTDDKLFTFSKRELSYIKPMNEDAVPYYVDMLNRQEDADALREYGYSSLVKPDDFADIGDLTGDSDEELDEKTKQLLEDFDGDINPLTLSTKKVLH